MPARADRRPNLAVVKEGNPGHRVKAELERGLKLKPGVPPEPDWTGIFLERPVVVPRARKAESVEQQRWRLEAQGDRKVAKDEAGYARRLASETWTKVVRILDAAGMVSDIDWLVLEDLAVTVVRIRQLERDISRRGFTLTGQKGSSRNGSITSAMQYRTEFRWQAGALGLTPAARDGLLVPDPGGAGDAEEGDDDFDV